MIPYITIELDKTYKLRLGMAAMVEYEQLTGKKIMELSDDAGMETYAKLLWVMLKQDNEQMTFKKTLKLIDDNFDNITDVVNILTEAITASFGNGEGNPKKPTKSS